MIIDALRYLGPARFHADVTVATTLVELDECGVDEAIVVTPKPPHGSMAAANDALLTAVKGEPRLTALTRIDPWEPECVERLHDDPSWRASAGFLLHPFEEACSVIAAPATRVFAELERLGRPTTVATGYANVSEGAQLALVAERFPDLPLILTTGGQLNMSGLAQQDALLALAHPNVAVHTTGAYREDFLLHVLDRIGTDRLLFATLSPTFESRFELARVQLAHLDEDRRAAVLGITCLRRFGRA
jgi:predicted TIM-barrel fold metal-dependent hydrolase